MSPLRGILNLSKEVPRELLAVSEGDYADFVLAGPFSSIMAGVLPDASV
jgi:hypothetical protein